MANEYNGADFAPHTVMGAWNYLLDWATATGTKDVLMGGYHPKMMIRNIYVVNLGAALNATEPIINVKVGGNEVVATVDMATAMSATAVVGEVAELTVIDTYAVVDEDDSIQIQIETADGGSDTRGLVMFNFELIE